MVARPRGPELLSAAFNVRLPPALLAAVDAFVAQENAADPYAVRPSGRTDVLRRALVEYLAARGALPAVPAAQAPAQRAEAPKAKPGKAKAPKGSPKGAQAPEDPFSRDLAALDLGELAPVDFDKGEP